MKQPDTPLWRVDMHCHSHYSADSFLRPEDFVTEAVKNGLNAVFLTDHDTVAGYEPLQEAAQGRLRVFRGQEISTTRGEIIGLFMRNGVAPGQRPEAVLDILHDQGALAYLPHPFARLVPSRLARRTIEQLASRFDVVEVVNARNILRRDDQRARSFAEGHGLLQGAGSDSHWGFELGRAFVEMAPFEDPDSFCAALRHGRVIDRQKSSYLLAGLNASVIPFRKAWWRWTRDPRGSVGEED